MTSLFRLKGWFRTFHPPTCVGARHLQPGGFNAPPTGELVSKLGLLVLEMRSVWSKSCVQTLDLAKKLEKKSRQLSFCLGGHQDTKSSNLINCSNLINAIPP